MPGHSLVDELLRQWDLGTIRVEGDRVVIDEDAQSWYRGVLGERRVAAELEALDDRWTVLHSVPVGKGNTDIDHVIVGQSGVFTINTKYSPGKEVWVAGYGMRVGGHKQHYVRNSISEASNASDLLSRASGLTVPVTALIVFVDPAKLTQKAPAAGGEYEPEVRIIRHSEVVGAIRTRPVFSTEQADRIAAAAIKATTWQQNPAPSTVGVHISGEFAALEAAMGTHLAGPMTRPQTKAPAAAASASPGPARPRPKQAPRPASRGSKRPVLVSSLPSSAW